MATDDCECDPVGLSDIDTRLGFAPGTARTYHSRGVLPEARWRASGRPLWDWPDIAAWDRDRPGPGRPRTGPRSDAEHPENRPA